MTLVVIVTGGAHKKSAELLYPNGTWLCALPDLPGNRDHHSQIGLLACGGGWPGFSGGPGVSTSCVTFSEGSWKKTHNLREGFIKKWKIIHRDNYASYQKSEKSLVCWFFFFAFLNNSDHFS